MSLISCERGTVEVSTVIIEPPEYIFVSNRTFFSDKKCFMDAKSRKRAEPFQITTASSSICAYASPWDQDKVESFSSSQSCLGVASGCLHGATQMPCDRYVPFEKFGDIGHYMSKGECNGNGETQIGENIQIDGK